MEFRPAVEAAARRAESTGPGNMLNYVEQCHGREGMVFPPGVRLCSNRLKLIIPVSERG